MSKDYSVIDGICRNFEYEAKTIFNKGYDQGVEDTEYEKEKAYEQGLNDAWNVFTKVVLSKKQGGLNIDEIVSIFHTAIYEDIAKFSPREAVKKIKAWEEEQTKDICKECPYNDGKPHAECVLCDKQTEDEIKVGDEVYILDKNHPAVITNVDPIIKRAVFFAQSGRWGAEDISRLHKTGRHFPEISEVLKQMRGEE